MNVKLFFGMFILFISLNVLNGLTGELAFLEGDVEIRRPAAGLNDAVLGMKINPGDSIITGLDGYCVIEMPGGSSMTIEAETVFEYNTASLEKDEEPVNIFHVAFGRISFVFGRLTGREPSISTPSSVLGIRGTEFTVASGGAGDSIYVVASGEVAVTSGEREINLIADEAVEAGINGLGDKIELKGEPIDYSSWIKKSDKEISKNPAGLMEGLTDILVSHLDNAEEIYAEYQSIKEKKDAAEKKIRDLRSSGEEIEAQDIVHNEYLPLKDASLKLILNYRYWAISALSLRQHTVSNIYVKIRTEYWDTEMPGEFISGFDRFMEIYEDRAVPFYEYRDI